MIVNAQSYSALDRCWAPARTYIDRAHTVAGKGWHRVTTIARIPSDEKLASGAEFLERYLEFLQIQRNLSPYTIRNYRSDLGHFLDWLGSQGLPRPS